jgi:hypothetical protein
MIPIMPSLEEVQALFRLTKPPAGLVVDLVEYQDEGDLVYYTIRLYRDNFDKLTQMNQFATADWLSKTIGNIKALVPCYLEVWRRPGVPE